MSIITKKLSTGKINFPEKDTTIIVENNIGDTFPIHIHLGVDGNRPAIRFHFTYDEFKSLYKHMKEEGKL